MGSQRAAAWGTSGMLGSSLLLGEAEAQAVTEAMKGSSIFLSRNNKYTLSPLSLASESIRIVLRVSG